MDDDPTLPRTIPDDDLGVANDPAVVILIPVFNDWASLSELLERLDGALAGAGEVALVVVVDDGSTEPIPPGTAGGPYRALRAVDVARLRRNLGHQRAIAVGLALLADRQRPPLTAVMDGDGEDDPADLPPLLRRCRDGGGAEVVFAGRARRSESPAFRLFYALYRSLFALLIGRAIRFGNYSVVPRPRLESLAHAPELWNHFAAAVIKSRQPFAAVPTRRGHRLAGRSRMNFVSLVIHGLSAISVFAEVVGARLLIASASLMGLSAAGIAATVAIRLFTSLAIPGWASTVVGLLAILFLQALQAAMLSAAFVFVVLGGRAAIGPMPIDDYRRFLRDVERIHGGP